ncbi:MAG: hypothetical protein WCS73_06350 [Lentisphaeria bacterium]
MGYETIKCPHCECKVSLSEVEKEDGICPECGQFVWASKLFDDYEDEEENDMSDYDDEVVAEEKDDYEDDFEDDFGSGENDTFDFDGEGNKYKSKRKKRVKTLIPKKKGDA